MAITTLENGDWNTLENGDWNSLENGDWNTLEKADWETGKLDCLLEHWNGIKIATAGLEG